MADQLVLQVSQLNKYVSDLMHYDPALKHIRLRGEIGSLKLSMPGHLYFKLKDDTASIDAVMFRQSASSLSFRPQNGDSVIVTGSVGLYQATGSYQITITAMRPEGVGNLYRQFEMIKQKLVNEGLTDDAIKKPLPYRPRKIAVITSQTGAVLHDICRVAARRDPSIPIMLIPATVQGSMAAESIVKALRIASKRTDIDVVIVGRGGGSMEDLWCFNEQSVARAIAACPHPVVSAVGHEVDFTIADFVADARASTPTHAAQLTVPDRRQVEEMFSVLRQRMTSTVKTAIHSGEMNLSRMRSRLEACSVKNMIADREKQLAMIRLQLKHAAEKSVLRSVPRMDACNARLQHAMQRQLSDFDGRVSRSKARLESLSPMAVLKRGYAIVSDEKGTITSASAAAAKERMNVIFADGTVAVVPAGKEEENGR